MNRFQIPKTEERTEKYHKLERILGEATTTKTLDAAVQICLNLKQNSSQFSPRELGLFVPNEYIAKFLVNEVQATNEG